MKLIDLDPVWLTPDMFMFRNPTGGNDWITCKRIVMSFKRQFDAIYPAHKGKVVVQTMPEMAWTFNGDDFTTMTIYPSIDASASGNWHGFIIDGEIR